MNFLPAVAVTGLLPPQPTRPTESAVEAPEKREFRQRAIDTFAIEPQSPPGRA